LAAGILPVFSAGNSGPAANTSTSPANYPEALAVGAVDGADLIWSLSSRGPSDCGETATIFPEIVAPGVGIYTLDRAGSFATRTGTSIAAPHAAGVLALLLSAYPGTAVQDQRDALIQSAFDLGEQGADNTYGHGRLDALAAFNWLAINYKTPTPTFTPTHTATPTLTPTFTPTPTATATPMTYHLPEIFREFSPWPSPLLRFLPRVYRQYSP
jgi:subtilisin family serine protease